MQRIIMPDLVSRGKFESRLADELVKVFLSYQLKIQELLSDFNTKLGDIKKLPPALYDQLQLELVGVLQDVLVEAYIDAFTSMDGFLADNSNETARRGGLFIRNDAEQWASFYAPQLAKDLANTTRQRLREIADRSPQLPISGLGLRDFIRPVFDLSRAQLVARTEVTNVISVAEEKAVNTFETKIEVVKIWYTKLDERVCIICEPRHGRPQGSNWEVPPPAHPRCRCEIKYKVVYPDGRTIEVRSLEEVQLGANQILVEVR
jgi:hypothetical protein